MKHKSKGQLVLLTMTGMASIGAGLAYMTSMPLHAHADVPSSVDVKSASAKDVGFTYSFGHRTVVSSGIGVHFIDGIKDTHGNYLFCVQWSKAVPSNTRIAAKVQATPAVTWLVNNYYQGASKRYQSLGQGDEGDYWLYQSVIHWITEPDDVSGLDGYNIQHFFGKAGLDSGVEAKIKKLHDKALKQAKDGTTEEVLNTHAMSFDPGSLKLNGDNLKNGKYSKNFTFKSSNMKNVKVWLDSQPSGTSISGGDLNNVKNGTDISVSMPYKDVATATKTFHVKAKGDWNKEIRVAYVYGDAKNTNQNVAKQVVKATTVPLDVTANMNVSVTPATGKITFTKKGSANNNSQILAGTKFELTSDGVSKTATADASGNVVFDTLPLGKDYTIKETSQPNKYYTGDLSSYNTKVTALNSDTPSLNAKAFGGTLVNKATHHDISIQKEDDGGGPIIGAQFVLVQVPRGSGFSGNTADAKSKGMHQSGEYIVGGDNGGKPVIATSDNQGKAHFSLVDTNPDRYDYYAVEVKAPDGYQLSLEPKRISVTAQGANILNSTIKDDLKTPMPSTGSKEMLYYLLGAGGLAIVGAGVFAVTVRSKHN